MTRHALIIKPGPTRQARLTSLAVAVAGCLLAPAHAQQATAWVVADAQSKHVLIEGGGDRKRPVDGFAAVATVAVTLDWAQLVGMDMATLATVPTSAVAGQSGNPMGLLPGDRISFRDLVYSVLLGADDSASLTLAANVGQDILIRRRKHGDPVEEFTREMQALAGKLGMRHTRFRSPHGARMGRSRDGGTSTARDLARLAIYAMGRPAFRFYSMQDARAVTVRRGEGAFRFRVRNYNNYAGVGTIDGVRVIPNGQGGPGAILTSKRSHEVVTLPGGRSMVYPRRVVAVAFGPRARQTARQLLDAGWRAFDQWTAQGRPPDPRRTL